MRAHGVPSFPDQSAGGGFEFKSSGISPSSPAFKSAQQSCSKYAPVGPSPNQPLSESQSKRLLALSQCMRAHGEPNYPDPTPSNPIVGKQKALSLNPNSPAFRNAAAACGAPGLFDRAGAQVAG